GAPVRPAWTEIGRRCERDVDLQPLRQQEHPIDRRAPRKIPVVDGRELALESFRPPSERRRELAADSEGEVDVRPFVAAAGDKRTGNCGADDVRILLGKPE